MDTIKVLIVDDHTLMRSGLKLMLANQPDIKVVGEAADGVQALALAAERKPDIVLLDVTMPGMNGLECLQRLKDIDSGVKVILLTMHEDISYLKQGFASGASGYVLKRAADEILYHAIRDVQDGQIFIQSDLAQTLVCDLQGKKASRPPEDIKALSEQEKRVLSLIAKGYSNAEIAEKLVVSTRTVETYKYRIMEKLNVKKRSDLVKFAMEQGLMKE